MRSAPFTPTDDQWQIRLGNVEAYLYKVEFRPRVGVYVDGPESHSPGLVYRTDSETNSA